MVNDNELKGTTTIGLVCSGGVVLATESRATMGHFIASKDAKKIYQIDDLVGMTTAGSVGDAQRLVKTMQVESKLYKMRRHDNMTIKGITSLKSPQVHLCPVCQTSLIVPRFICVLYVRPA
jgi:proteasome beta subunit